jgi:hypothetical protein
MDIPNAYWARLDAERLRCIKAYFNNYDALWSLSMPPGWSVVQDQMASDLAWLQTHCWSSCQDRRQCTGILGQGITWVYCFWPIEALSNRIVRESTWVEWRPSRHYSSSCEQLVGSNRRQLSSHQSTTWRTIGQRECWREQTWLRGPPSCVGLCFWRSLTIEPTPPLVTDKKPTYTTDTSKESTGYGHKQHVHYYSLRINTRSTSHPR